MRPKSLVLLLLALGCGLVASIGINQVLANRRTPQAAAKGPTEPIFVAVADVDTWEPLTVQNVKLEEWPTDRIPAGAVRKLEDLENRRVRTKIYQGEPILAAKLLGADASKGSATGLIPKGFRAVSVRVDQVSGGSSLIMPNDRVDVLVHIQANPGKGFKQSITRTILQDVQVFAVNEVFRKPDEAEESAIAAKTITLLVTPEDAELLTLATEMGKIRLVMRSPEDDAASATEGAVANQLLNKESSKGNRDDESLMKDPGQDTPAGQDLVGFLNQQQVAPPPAEPAPPAAPETVWRMVVLLGAQATEFEFTKDSRLPRQVGVENPAAAGPGDAAATDPAAAAPTNTDDPFGPQAPAAPAPAQPAPVEPAPSDSTQPVDDLPQDWDQEPFEGGLEEGEDFDG